MKRALLSIISMIIILSVFAGCNTKKTSDTTATTSQSPTGSTAPSTSKDPIELNIFANMLTQRGSDEDAVISEIEKRILKDRGINVKLNFFGSDNDQAAQTISMKLAANEIDAFNIASSATAGDMMAKGMTMPLDDLLPNYPNIMKQTNPDAWSQGTFQGKKLMIPIKPPVRLYITPWIRKDLLDQVGLPIPTTFNEYGDAIRKIKATDKNLLGMSSKNAGWIFTQALGNGFDQMDANGNFNMTAAGMFPTSTYWRSWIERIQQWYKEGIMNKEVFTMKQDQMPDLLNSGRLIALADGFGFQSDADRLAGVDPKQPLPAGAKKQIWVNTPLMDGDRPMTWSYGKMSSQYIGIAKNSKHAKEVLTVLDWMGENINNAILANFGIEGKEYTKNGDKIVVTPPNGGVPLYDQALGHWAGGFFGSELTQMSTNFIGTEWKKAFDPNLKTWFAVDSDVAYTFEKSKDVLPNIGQIGGEFFAKAVSGQITLNDQAYQKLIDNLNKAGIKTYMDEMTEQYKKARENSK